MPPEMQAQLYPRVSDRGRRHGTYKPTCLTGEYSPMSKSPGVFDAVAWEVTYDDQTFAARMTQHQFQALHLLIESRWSEEDLRPRRPERPLAKNCAREKVRSWLLNAWGTEYLLREGKTALGDSAGVGLQWAFPQAYYACFAYIHAWLEASGTKIESHSKLRADFANTLKNGRYPHAISFYAGGGRNKNVHFHGIDEPSTRHSSIRFSESDERSWNQQVCQFLRTTRTRSLELARNKRAGEFKTSSGKPKKRLSPSEWQRVSAGCPPTTVLDLLYRKRIKANYDDVSVFSSAAIDGPAVYDSLVGIVARIGQIHEAFIANRDEQLVDAAFEFFLARRDVDFLRSRRTEVLQRIACH